MSSALLDDFATQAANWGLEDEWLALALTQLPRTASTVPLAVFWQATPEGTHALCLGATWWALSPLEQWANTRLQVHHLLLGHLADWLRTPQDQLAVFGQAYHYLPEHLQAVWPEWQALVASWSDLPAHPDLPYFRRQLDQQDWRSRFPALLSWLAQSCVHWRVPFGKSPTRQITQSLELQLTTSLAELSPAPGWSELVALWQNKRHTGIHWSTLLRWHLRRYHRRKLDVTHKRISRRYGTSPGIRLRQQALLGVVLDTSASVSTSALVRCYEELSLMHRLGHRICLLEADTAVRRVQWFDPRRSVRAFPGRGNTAYDPAIRYLADQNVDLIIYLTDGLGPPPQPVSTDLLWVVQAAAHQTEMIRQKMSSWPGSCIFLS